MHTPIKTGSGTGAAARYYTTTAVLSNFIISFDLHHHDKALIKDCSKRYIKKGFRLIFLDIKKKIQKAYTVPVMHILSKYIKYKI